MFKSRCSTSPRRPMDLADRSTAPRYPYGTSRGGAPFSLCATPVLTGPERVPGQPATHGRRRHERGDAHRAASQASSGHDQGESGTSLSLGSRQANASASAACCGVDEAACPKLAGQSCLTYCRSGSPLNCQRTTAAFRSPYVTCRACVLYPKRRSRPWLRPCALQLSDWCSGLAHRRRASTWLHLRCSGRLKPSSTALGAVQSDARAGD